MHTYILTLKMPKDISRHHKKAKEMAKSVKYLCKHEDLNPILNTRHAGLGDS